MSIGQLAYEAYVKHYPGPAASRAHPWWRLPKAVQEPWQAAAHAVQVSN